MYIYFTFSKLCDNILYASLLELLFYLGRVQTTYVYKGVLICVLNDNSVFVAWNL